MTLHSINKLWHDTRKLPPEQQPMITELFRVIEHATNQEQTNFNPRASSEVYYQPSWFHDVRLQ
jgi:hypothetical protein